MQRGHWVGMIVVLIIGYFIGVTWPSLGSGAVSKVKGLV